MTLHPITNTHTRSSGAPPAAPGAGSPTRGTNETTTTARPVHTTPVGHGIPGQTQAQHDLASKLYLALAVLLSMVDIILIKSIFNAILGGEAWESWLLAAATAAGATLLAWYAGQQAALAVVNRVRSHTVWAIIAAAAWVSVGLAFTLMRWNLEALTGAGVVYEDQAAATAATGINSDHLIAICLAAFYILVGVLAAGHAYMLSDPITAHERATAAEVDQLRHQLPHDEARAVEMQMLLARHHDELNLIETHKTNATRAAADLAHELKAAARTAIAYHLGTPHAVAPPTPAAHTDTDTDTGNPGPDDDGLVAAPA